MQSELSGDMPIRHRLLAARIKAGHTQVQAAKAVNKNERTWRRWENGEIDVPPEILLLYEMLTGQRKG